MTSLDEYFQKSLGSFESKISRYFISSPDKTKKEITEPKDIFLVLKDLKEIGEYVIVDIGPANFDKFKDAEIENGLIKIVWYEEFDSQENKKKDYVEFRPQKLLFYHDALRRDNNLIAIKARDVKIVSSCEDKPTYEDNFGEELILLHPKGSIYAIDQNSALSNAFERLDSYL